MEVTSVSASVRFSGAVGPSRFKTVELSAEATVQGDEDWQDAQSELYQELGKQVKYCACKARRPWKGLRRPQRTSQCQAWLNPPPTVQDHYCPEHQTEFKRYHRGADTWYSHKTVAGAWCRETQPD